MYKPGGIAYIYVCYGMNHLMNVVTGPRESAHAILIRALEQVEGVDDMAQRRAMQANDFRLTKGPGSLSIAMGLTSQLSGISLTGKDASIWIEDRNIIHRPELICSGPRIGVESAGESAQWPRLFFIKGNKYVSTRKSCS